MAFYVYYNRWYKYYILGYNFVFWLVSQFVGYMLEHRGSLLCVSRPPWRMLRPILSWICSYMSARRILEPMEVG